MTEIVELACAKINLTLRVRGRRSDGYHEIESLVAFADIGDRVLLSPRKPSIAGGPRPASLTVSGQFSSAIAGDNLVETAIRRVEEATGCPIDAAFALDKQLPVASGIGGGSADAAAALRAIRSAYSVLAASIDWAEIARGLGADVPVCLASRSAIMTGTGAQMRPVALPPLDIVLVNTLAPVPADKTRRVFQALSAAPLTGAALAPALIASKYDRASLLDEMRRCGNDLEIPARSVLPEIAIAKTAVASTTGCEMALLSGAGPTIVGVYTSAGAARVAAGMLSNAHPSWWVQTGTVASP